MLREVTCTIGGIEDFIVEDAEVEGKAETNGVCRSEFGLCNVGSVLRAELDLCCLWFAFCGGQLSYLVGLMGSSGSNLALLSRGKFGEVSVIVALPIDPVRMFP